MDPGFTVQDVIVEALERLGGEASVASEALSARRSLRLILEEWAAMHLNTWRIRRTQFMLPSFSGGNVLSPDVDDILDVLIREPNSPNELSIERFSRDAYADVPDKSMTGRPTCWYLERTDPATLFFWPTGDDGQIAQVWYLARPQGVLGRDWEVDAPGRWLPALVAGLAYELGQKRPDLAGERLIALKARYDELLSVCRMNDRERVSFRVGLGWY